MADREGQEPAAGDVRDSELEQIAVQHQEDLEALAGRRARVGAILTMVMLVVYFGFILLIAFYKDGLGDLITDGLSVGMLLGVIVVLTTWVLTWIYVGWANRKYEPEVQRLKAGRE